MQYTKNPRTGKSSTTPVNDQTVWHFTTASNGYLLGCSVATTDNGSTWSKSDVVGSVLANGSVSIGFYCSSLTIGHGSLLSDSGKLTFLMQMSAGNGNVGLTHWAYMLPITATDPYWLNLSGTSNIGVIDALNSGGCGL